MEALQIALALFGGLALFIYGMNLMSDGLQKAAGEKMKSILSVRKSGKSERKEMRGKRKKNLHFSISCDKVLALRNYGGPLLQVY